MCYYYFDCVREISSRVRSGERGNTISRPRRKSLVTVVAAPLGPYNGGKNPSHVHTSLFVSSFTITHLYTFVYTVHNIHSDFLNTFIPFLTLYSAQILVYFLRKHLQNYIFMKK